MTDLLVSFFAGFVAFLVGLLRFLPLRPGGRDPEIVFAIFSIIVLLTFLAAGFGLSTDFSWRVSVFYGGTVAAYFLSRLFPRRERDAPRLPPQYVALSRRIDETFKAMEADDAMQGVLPGDPIRAKAHLRALERDFKELQREGQRLRSQRRHVVMAGFIGTLLFLAYLAVQYLMV